MEDDDGFAGEEDRRAGAGEEERGRGAADEGVELRTLMICEADDDTLDEVDDAEMLVDDDSSSRTSGWTSGSAVSISSTVMIMPPASVVGCTVPETITRASRESSSRTAELLRSR